MSFLTLYSVCTTIRTAIYLEFICTNELVHVSIPCIYTVPLCSYKRMQINHVFAIYFLLKKGEFDPLLCHSILCDDFPSCV